MAKYVYVYTRMLYILHIQPHIIAHCAAVNHHKRRKNTHNEKLCLNHFVNNTISFTYASALVQQ